MVVLDVLRTVSVVRTYRPRVPADHPPRRLPLLPGLLRNTPPHEGEQLMPQPGMISHGLPPRPNDVQRELADLRRQIDQMHGVLASTLGATANTANTANSTANTAYAAATAPGVVSQTATNFAVPAAGATLITKSVTVPSAFTQAAVTLVGRVFATNPGASSDFLYARPVVNGITANAVPVQAPTGVGVLNVGTIALALTGLGSSFTVSLWASSSAADWSPSAANLADLSGSIVWFK